MKKTFFKIWDVPAFLGEDFSTSYTEAFAIISAAADKIPESTKHIAIYAENSIEWICALYAAWMRGCVVIPIDAGLNADEAAFILGDSDTDRVFTSQMNLEKAKAAIEKSGRNIEISMIEDMERPSSFSDQADGKIERELSDLALIVYTSGTTSKPKGVMLTFDNLQANIEGVADEGYFVRGMRVLAMLPFQHILPLMGTIVAPMYVGGSTIFPKSIAPADIASVLVKHKATMVVSVPRFYELIHANIKEKVNRSFLIGLLFKLSRCVGSMKFSRLLFGSVHKRFGGHVKYWICGGAALEKQAGRDMNTLGFFIAEGYGMTECAPIISFPRVSDLKVGACGQALLGNEVRIVDGEITVRGRSVTQGYYKRPEENEETFKNGWLYTGDLGYLDEEGFVFITGRRKEIIVLPNGKKLNPLEIEYQVKEKCPEIEEVGVLMYDDILQGVVRVSESLMAEKGEEAVNDLIRENAILPYNRGTASYRRIMRFSISTKEFPRTRIGKLKRFQLASFIESLNAEIPQIVKLPPEPESKIYQELKDFMSMQVSVPVTADAHLEMDLALDSLGKISLLGFIKESYSVDMKESDFEKYSTMRGIAEHVENENEKPKDSKAKTVSWSEILKNCSNVLPKIPKTYFFHAITLFIAKHWLGRRYDVTVSGAENLPSEGPLLVAPNHQSLCDGFLFAIPLQKKRMYNMYFFAKVRKMMKSSLMRFFVRHSNIVLVDVRSNVRESLQNLAELLRKKKTIVIFPEGTRTRDGEVADFKQTFAILAKELDVPVVPVVISGAYEGLESRDALPAKGTKIKVEFLPKVNAEENESYEQFASRVRSLVVDAKSKIEGKTLE